MIMQMISTIMILGGMLMMMEPFIRRDGIVAPEELVLAGMALREAHVITALRDAPITELIHTLHHVN
jgi:hypothetical protein